MRHRIFPLLNVSHALAYHGGVAYRNLRFHRGALLSHSKGTRGYDYTRGSVGWAITRLSVPICGERILRNLDGIFEIYWLGQLGAEALAAASLGFITLLFIRSAPFGLRIAGQALVAQRVGANDSEGASIMAGQTILLVGVFTLIVTIAGFWLAPLLMGLMTSDSALAALGVVYIRSGFTVLLAVEAMFVIGQILRGTGEPAITIAGVIASTVLTLIFIPLFMFGSGPIPALGIAGSFLGIGVGRLGGFVTMLAFIVKGKSRLRLRWADLRPRGSEVSRVVRLAWPAMAQNLLERSALLLMVRMLSPFGASALAAWSIGNHVTMIARMPSFGLQSSVRTLVGQNLGAEKPERVARTVWLSVAALGFLMTAVSVCLFAWAQEVVSVFGMKGNTTAVMALRILCAGLLMESVRRVMAGAFQGASRSKPPMMVEGIVRWGLQLPAAYLLSFWLAVGAGGVWWAVSGGQILSGALLFAWFLHWTRSGDILGFMGARGLKSAREST